MDRRQFVVGSSAGGVAAALQALSPRTYTQLADLQEAAEVSDGSLAFVTEQGREGLFLFISRNLSEQVAGDILQAIYLPPATDRSGSSGAWVRQFEGAANVHWWGALGDGFTDNHSALQAALNSSLDIFFPSGTYNCGSPLKFGANRYCGEGLGRTIIDFRNLGPGESALSPAIAGQGDWSFAGMSFIGPGRDSKSAETCVNLTSTFDDSEVRFQFENCKFEDWNKAGILISGAWNGEAERCYFQKCGDTSKIAGGSVLTGTGGIVFEESNSTPGWAGSGFIARSCEYTSCSYGIYNDTGWNVIDQAGVYQYCAFPFFKSSRGTPMIMIAPWMEDFGSSDLYRPAVAHGEVILIGGRSTTGADNPKLHILDPETASFELTAFSGSQECRASIEATRHDISTGASKLRFRTTNARGASRNKWEIDGDGHLNPFIDGEQDVGNESASIRDIFIGGQVALGDSRIKSGEGSPEGNVSAPVGSLYTRTDGGAQSVLYVKERGIGNTGWVAK